MGSPDKPYVARGGGDYQAQLANRINAIERIKHLSSVDMTLKSKEYLKIFDMWMYKKWYSKYPVDHPIDEEWCQRASEVAKDMDSVSIDYDKARKLASEAQQTFSEYKTKLKKEKSKTIYIKEPLYHPSKKAPISPDIKKSKTEKFIDQFLAGVKSSIKKRFKNKKGRKE